MMLWTNSPLKRYVCLLHSQESCVNFLFFHQDVATYLKKRCDEGLTGTWHSIVGRNFGCSITHDTKYVLFLQIDQMHVLIFKSLE
jgi:dynein light chain LC8-type